MKMKIISAFTAIYYLLCATRVDGEDIRAAGPEGGQVSFRCSHRVAQNNQKYFCKDPCKKDEHILAKVKPGGNMKSGWIALHDTGDGAFSVTLSQLKISDAGTYWCAVDRVGIDTFTRVDLTVREDRSQKTTTTNSQYTNTEATTLMVLETTRSWTPGYEIITNHTTKEIFQSDTKTNSSQGHKAEQQTTTSIVLYLIVGVLALFTASVVVLLSLRKCRRKSRPQVQVCFNPLHVIRVDQNKLSSPKNNMADRNCSKHESAALPTPAEQNQTLYENISYIKNVAETKHSAITRNEHFPSYIEPLPALPGQDCVDKDTPRCNVETCTRSSCSEATEQLLWFGLVYPQTLQPQ